MQTVADLYDYVRGRVAPGPDPAARGPYAGELWERYLDVIAQETGVPRARLRPEARFVDDLGLD